MKRPRTHAVLLGRVIVVSQTYGPVRRLCGQRNHDDGRHEEEEANGERHLLGAALIVLCVK